MPYLDLIGLGPGNSRQHADRLVDFASAQERLPLLDCQSIRLGLCGWILSRERRARERQRGDGDKPNTSLEQEHTAPGKINSIDYARKNIARHTGNAMPLTYGSE